MRVDFFDDALVKFVASLEKPTIAKVMREIDLLEKFGHQLDMPHSKKVAPDLFELRVRGTQEVRIFYTFFDERAVLLQGFVKKSRRMPPRERTLAVQKLNRLTTI